ncbi:MAG: DUF3368 domain-containing protein [Phycisphaerae bacterium]
MIERRGRQVAIDRGLKVVGILGLIEIAAEQKLIPIQPTIDLLLKTNFRIHPRLVQRLLTKHLGHPS